MLHAQKIGLFLMLVGNVLPSLSLSAEKNNSVSYVSTLDLIDNYYANFENLAKLEMWKEIISEGVIALEAAKNANRFYDEAKISAQLTSTSFYLGDYAQALMYASHCHELSEEFVDKALFLRALYLESAVYRALAAKDVAEHSAQASYFRAVEIAEEASIIYSASGMQDLNLKGKIYFNLGAAHADNPQGDLKKAKNAYFLALECFKSVNAKDDLIRTCVRLGKVYLLQKNYQLSQTIIDEVRPQVSSARIVIQIDYLEGQLKLAQNDIENALRVASNGLALAKALGAKEDELRLTSLLQKINDVVMNGSSSIGYVTSDKTSINKSLELQNCLVDCYQVDPENTAVIRSFLDPLLRDPKYHSVIDAFIEKSKELHIEFTQTLTQELSSEDGVLKAEKWHTIIFESPHIRILRGVVESGEHDSFHLHQWDRLMVVIQGAPFRTEFFDGTIEVEDCPIGVYELEGETTPSAYTNIGDAVFEALVFEIKR